MKTLSIYICLLFGWILIALAFAPQADASEPCPVSWDKTFQKSTRVYMPLMLKHDWIGIKAQALTESNCRPHVCSRAGACGVLQIMPLTWQDLTDKDHAHIFEPKLNIIMGTRYMAWQASNWLGRDREPEEVFDLAAAGYNAGIGRVLKAQAICKGVRLWENIAPCMQVVIALGYMEPINYVIRIKWWRGQLE